MHVPDFSHAIHIPVVLAQMHCTQNDTMMLLIVIAYNQNRTRIGGASFVLLLPTVLSGRLDSAWLVLPEVL